MGASRRQFIVGAGAAGLTAAGARCAAPAGAVTPEMFGAKGDGRTNDTDAFAAMSEHVNARGGGTIVLRPVTYIVGRQQRGRGRNEPSFAGAKIIRIEKCKRAVTIRGNGAKLKCAPGLRFGRFDPQSGNPLPNGRKLDLTNRAVPYWAMININHCSGPIEVSNIELDGNLQRLVVGGRYGKGGYQSGGTGLVLSQNRGPERLARIRSHHHAQDGMTLAPAGDRRDSTLVTDSICEFNGRQGVSVTGGRNLLFQRCKFRHTGRAGIHGSPGAGVDVEAERSPIRNVAFEDCEFSDNHGFGLVAGTGKSADLRFDRCKFVGTTNWSAWPDRPQMRFRSCLFVGAINHARGDADPARAAQFLDCTFTDDPALSPTGKVFLPKGKWIAIILKSPNVRFRRCHFRLIADGVLPLSQSQVIYEDCDMSQRSAAPSGPRGTYLGTTSIRGNAHLEDSIIRGKVTLNGRILPQRG
ncbi:MAG TPA: right-handed parallel beta-helix repeat-containing protein [Sphingomicrobium sp.]|nr:right-handed parallel beta-helix repeat-containing protein [Sphingomicrobium sp.]